VAHISLGVEFLKGAHLGLALDLRVDRATAARAAVVVVMQAMP